MLMDTALGLSDVLTFFQNNSSKKHSTLIRLARKEYLCLAET